MVFLNIWESLKLTHYETGHVPQLIEYLCSMHWAMICIPEPPWNQANDPNSQEVNSGGSEMHSYSNKFRDTLGYMIFYLRQTEQKPY